MCPSSTPIRAAALAASRTTAVGEVTGRTYSPLPTPSKSHVTRRTARSLARSLTCNPQIQRKILTRFGETIPKASTHALDESVPTHEREARERRDVTLSISTRKTFPSPRVLLVETLGFGIRFTHSPSHMYRYVSSQQSKLCLGTGRYCRIPAVIVGIYRPGRLEWFTRCRIVLYGWEKENTVCMQCLPTLESVCRRVRLLERLTVRLRPKD